MGETKQVKVGGKVFDITWDEDTEREAELSDNGALLMLEASAASRVGPKAVLDVLQHALVIESLEAMLYEAEVLLRTAKHLRNHEYSGEGEEESVSAEVVE